ncbi:TetR/AcrR family transcriptional regulator [Pseudoalteromonas peptidolytica]|nr:TetR/AcrR family transcriptional regulator [Pseudoalteromonas peptidolytica]
MIGRRKYLSTRAEQKDKAIKDAATKLFIKNGLDGVSVDDIAKAAKVSKPTIYSRYKTKEKLFVAILIGECEKQIEKMFEPRGDKQTLEDFIHKKAFEYISFITDPWYVNLLRNAIYYSGHFDEIGEAFLRFGPRKGVSKLANSLAVEIDKGELKAVDPSDAAEFIISRSKSNCFFNAILARTLENADEDIKVEAMKIKKEFLLLFKA